jgi:alkaline phosphatase D
MSHPPDAIRYGGREITNPRRQMPPQSFLGRDRKTWLLDRLKTSGARWKIWGHSFGTLEWRSDFQNLPAGAGPTWPGQGTRCSAATSS